VNNVRTVSDTKRAFCQAYTRPINSIYRRVAEELMVEMHLLTVNVTFAYDSIYALGVVTTFDRFMQGYTPEADRAAIFSAICSATGGDVQKFRQDAEQLLAAVPGLSWDKLVTAEVADPLAAQFRQVSGNAKFKYSRLFAIGLYTLLEALDPEAVKTEDKLKDALGKLGSHLNIGDDKLQKDLELYRSNIDKMAQAQAAMADVVAAERKKRAQRDEAKAAAAAAAAEAPTEPTAAS
jgi:photosystem II biogenesis protein Psp29